MPPPPPSNPFPPQPGGYQPYGGAPQKRTNGLGIAGFVLALVGFIPCFWFWILQIPGYLGVIFSAIGLKKAREGTHNQRGLSIAGLVIGIIVVLIALAITAYAYTSDNCVTDGLFDVECST
jgi:uncharacterized membrane protein